VAALQSLARQVAELQADNDRLRGDNDRLSAEAERLRALMRQAGGAIARQASQLLAGTGD
jgi:cell division protein FtsB